MEKKKIDIRIIVILILLVILITMVGIYFERANNTNTKKSFDMSDFEDITSEIDIDEETASSTSSSTVVSSSAQIKSALTENISLHATYYFSECYVSENDVISEGEYILQYSNGTYLEAPYDCAIIEMNLPEEGEVCTNQHYIQISSTQRLAVRS